ncbi:MAG: hypothetical protein HUU20_09080 [Pirellulales bacterium]|nr:hypothetical protein [Pirellulales bacterium]
MPKALCILGMVIALLLLILFGLDLALGIPFSKASSAMDIGLIVAAAILGYLSWATFREQL